MIASELAPLLGHQPTTIIWAAGVGHVGASAGQLAAETDGLAAVADVLRSLPRIDASITRVIFASSAGALFAGTRGIIDQTTSPKPISAYGQEKLRQEALLARIADESGACVVACRISNLYGLAGGRLTRRGLVSTAVRSSRLRQPLTIFVSADTRRDYVLNTDAAGLALMQSECAPPGFSTTFIREGRTRTVSEVLRIVGATAHRRVPAVYAERPETKLQPRSIRFARPGAGEVQFAFTPMETGVARMLKAPLAP